jgi:hypothetical protein
VQRRFGGLANAEPQLRAWFAPLLARVEAIDDIAALQPAFGAVNAALARLRAEALAATLDAVLVPLQAALDDLDPANRLAALSRARRGVSTAALPASAERAAIDALLARLDPLAPSFARPFEGLQAWRSALARDRAALAGLLTHWDRRLHGEHGLLAGLAQTAPTAQALRAIIGDALERELIRPLAALVGALHETVSSAAPVIEQIAVLARAFEDKVALFVTGPAALGGIRDALAALIARLRAIDLGFLVEELDATFQAVKGKLEAVGPAAVQASVQHAFDQALDALDLNRLLPAAALTSIDASYAAILDGLRALDPKRLVVDTVQPIYDQRVLPLIEAFDITVVLTALIERLDALELELSGEFDKVNTSYQQMLAAVPTISLTDISLDVDLGVDIGF